MFIHYMYVDILFPLTKVILIMYERVTTHYQTLQTRIGHNATRYHNFNALPHALPYMFAQFTHVGHNATCYHNFNVLPHVIPYIFTQFNMVWGYLQ